MSAEIKKYLIAGIVAFICDFSILYFCTEFLEIHYLASNIYSYLTGLTVSYLLNVNWVFSYRRYQRTWLELLIFNAIVLTGLGISESTMALLVNIFQLHYLEAKIVSSVLVLAFNYTAKKFILFHPSY